MKKVDLNNYICAVPFTSIEVHDTKRFLCCASWLTKFLPDDTKPYDAWNSDEANDIRNSILDGSYKYCDANQCPFLHQLNTFGDVGRIYPLYHKDDLSPDLKLKIEKHKEGKLTSPQIVQFSMDRSCNLECPSCRLKMFIADSTKIKKVKQDIQDIEDAYGSEVNVLYITGSGDPFVSVGFRDFLRNFDKTKWPKLKSIHLHTNATRWNKEMWESMPNVHPYVKSCEISIDAGTRETYETKTRINGDWDVLLDNLKFISTIPTLSRIKPSFVVQQKNYKEMKTFYDLMYSIFGEKVNVYFGKITNWGTFSNEEYLTHQIWNESHPEYNDFINEVNSFLPIKNSYNNIQEFISPIKSLI
jgi:sulfatase maturation enzyme AslB (radical SAM superfamily)